MNIDILTFFLGMFEPVFGARMLGCESVKGFLNINAVNLRDIVVTKNKKSDDTTFVGRTGMVMTAQTV